MSPRTGRPTNDPKTRRVEFRLSVLDNIKLDSICDKLNITKTEAVRKGINSIYQELRENIEKGGGSAEIKTSTHVFQLAIDNKDVDDMKHVMNEFLQFGYKKISEFVYEGNTIIVFAKKL